jgi:hypothetical protein
MKAKKKPVEKLTSAELGIDLTPRLETIKVTEPLKRVGGGKVIPIPSLCFHVLTVATRWQMWTSFSPSSKRLALLASTPKSCFSPYSPCITSISYYLRDGTQGHYKLIMILSMCRGVRMTADDLITMVLSSHNINLEKQQ